jgi:hypothetical protein
MRKLVTLGEEEVMSYNPFTTLTNNTTNLLSKAFLKLMTLNTMGNKRVKRDSLPHGPKHTIPKF